MPLDRMEGAAGCVPIHNSAYGRVGSGSVDAFCACSVATRLEDAGRPQA